MSVPRAQGPRVVRLVCPRFADHPLHPVRRDAAGVARCPDCRAEIKFVETEVGHGK